MWNQLNDSTIKQIKKVGFKKPTEIQQKTLDDLLKNKSLVGISATGSGKTHAFLIPIFEKINDKKAIIISPTRELAIQTYNKTKEFLIGTNVKVRLLIGGEDREKQINKLNSGFDIIIATPGRLVDIYNLGFNEIVTSKTLVIDECDTIFSLGFLNEVDFILNKMKNDTQVLLFSATLQVELQNFIKKYLKNPKVVMIDTMSYINKNIENIAYQTKHKDKLDVIIELTKSFDPYILMVFANKKEDVKRISNHFRNNNLKTIELHGDLLQRERKGNLKKVNSGDCKYIIASDIAARGIDIDGVSHVIHYDLPLHDLDFFVHRSGRTGRGKNTGKNFILYNDQEDKIISKLEKKGINFKFLEYKKGEWIDLKAKKNKQKYKISEVDKKINVVINRVKKQTVKPGYKKKMKKEIDGIKRFHKRQIIKSDIKKQRKERYKKSQSLLDQN